MKNFFLALLLANVLFVAWRLWVAPAEVPPTELLAAGEQPEVAMLTADNPARPAGAAAGAGGGAGSGAGSVPGSGKCTRLGPIADGQVADSLRARLSASDIQSAMTTQEGQLWVGHWVQIESVATREEAERGVARLTAGGLPDAYVLQTSPPFSISLGVFRDRARADSIAASARGLGFRPQVTDRFRAGTEYWLTFVLPAGKTLPLDELVRESGQILRAEQVACPAPSIGGDEPIQ